MLDHFVAGCDFVEAELAIRLRGWSVLPLKGFTLAHSDMEKVIAGLIDCLAQHEHYSEEELRTQCWLSFAL